MTTILLAPNKDLAASLKAEITVEAEYGNEVVEGTAYTAAHHGPRAGNPCPCVDPNIPVVNGGTILISHIDLDALGGVARAIGHPTAAAAASEFWKTAAFVDVNGPHRLAEAQASPAVEQQLHAWWAWAQGNRETFSRTEVSDATAAVKKSLDKLSEIFESPADSPLIQEGERFKEEGERLNVESHLSTFTTAKGVRIILRTGDCFLNHLYNFPAGDDVADGVLAFNAKTKTITLSWERGEAAPASAAELMQTAFGTAAGGRRGIAGSPRGEEMRLDDLYKVIEAIVNNNI